jgi:hypothetical protein
MPAGEDEEAEKQEGRRALINLAHHSVKRQEDSENCPCEPKPLAAPKAILPVCRSMISLLIHKPPVAPTPLVVKKASKSLAFVT